MKYSALTQLKHSVRSFTQTAAKELADKGITVNAYCPGVAKTEMWDRIDEEMVKLDDSLEIGTRLKHFLQKSNLEDIKSHQMLRT